MKTNIRHSIFLALLPAFFLLVLTEGCKKASDTTAPDQQEGEFILKGSVINASTHTGIANARVYFDEQTILTTDANGNYKVNCRTTGCGVYNVRVMAAGYGFGFASATIANDAAMVNTIMLKPLAEPVLIGSAGGTVAIADPEGFTPGSKTTLVIPNGAFSNEINVTLTRFTGIDVPGYAPASMLNLCAVNLGPADAVAGKAMDLSFAMPFVDPTVDNLPLLRYNFEENKWVNTGAFAQVDHAANLARVQVSAFGAYSLAIEGTFLPSAGTSAAAVTLPLDPSLSFVDFSYLAKNVYPEGTPATISASYLKNIASQNTRVNFSDVTTFTFNYIGAKPDSLAAGKSTLSGFYRWVPKVSYADQDIPVVTTIHGVTASGIMQRPIYAPASGYQFVHDQGGGGK
jgi:hypothetical protein